MRLLTLLLSFVCVGAAQVPRAAVIAELNYARQQPQACANVIQQWASHFRGRLLMLPGMTAIMTDEGVSAVLEAVRALRATRPMGELAESPALDRAAEDLVWDEGPHGARGHIGSDGSQPSARMQRYAQGLTAYGEANAYGPTNARWIVIGLLSRRRRPRPRAPPSSVESHLHVCRRVVRTPCHLQRDVMSVIDMARRS